LILILKKLSGNTNENGLGLGYKMADELTIEIRGIAELSRKNNEIVSKIAESGNLVAKAALIIERQAKINASGRPGPKVQTGRLRASITTQIDSPVKARVGTNVKYAKPVEYGHAQEVGRFVPIYALRNVGGLYEVSRGLGVRLKNPRAPAYPFMGPTINQTKDQMNGVMVEFGKDCEDTYNK
jgi:HK97 gp10 family phage protein